jgi:hypothetical protein
VSDVFRRAGIVAVKLPIRFIPVTATSQQQRTREADKELDRQNGVGFPRNYPRAAFGDFHVG